MKACVRWAQIKREIDPVLDLSDDDFLDVAMATVLAVDLPSNPVWMMIVDASGGSKTEVLRMLDGPRIYHATGATANAFVSGAVIKRKPKGHENDPDVEPERIEASFLARLHNHVWIARDFSQMLELPPDQRCKVFGQLRNAYDGDMAQVFGGEAQEQRFQCHFGILAAVTPIWEKVVSSTDKAFGERFICFRPYPKDRLAFSKHVLEMAATSHKWRPRLQGLIRDFLTKVKVPTHPPFGLDDGILHYLADFCAIARSPASRCKYTKELEFMPEAEYGSRIAVQLYYLSGILNWLGANAERICRRIVQSTIPQKRRLLLELLYQRGNLRITDATSVLPFSSNTVKYELDNMCLLGLLRRTKRGGSKKKGRGASPYIYTVEPRCAKSFDVSMSKKGMDNERDKD